MNAIYGLYPGPDAAQGAVRRLRAAGKQLGVRPQDICVLAAEPFEEPDLGWREQKTPMPWLAALGGLIGMASAYLLASLTQRAYPLPTGNMPIVALWPTAVIVYEGTMFGAILTTFLTLLVGARIPSGRRRLYDPEIADGKILVGAVDPPESSLATLEGLLRDTGAHSVKKFSSR